MDGEIVHALFGLLDQRVAENFPGQIFRAAIHLFQRLINRNGSNRYRRVADDPFACLKLPTCSVDGKSYGRTKRFGLIKNYPIFLC